jgi:hypothetical protein
MREYQDVKAASRRDGQNKLPARLQLYRILSTRVVTLSTLSLFSPHNQTLSFFAFVCFCSPGQTNIHGNWDVPGWNIHHKIFR